MHSWKAVKNTQNIAWKIVPMYFCAKADVMFSMRSAAGINGVCVSLLFITKTAPNSARDGQSESLQGENSRRKLVLFFFYLIGFQKRQRITCCFREWHPTRPCG